MAHTHNDVHRDVEIIERDGGRGVTTGLMVAIAALVIFAIIALAVLFARPWDDGGANNNPNVPGVSDNSGGGNNNGGAGDSGGSSGGDSGGTSGGDAQPAQ